MKMLSKLFKISNYINYLERFWRPFLISIRLQGAIYSGQDESGLNVYKLNRETLLGKKDDLVWVYQDDVLHFNILNYGIYEKSLVKFFRNQSLNYSQPVMLLDIGANSGLIAKSICLDNTVFKRIILVEPQVLAGRAIRKNLLSVSQEFTVLEVALSKVSGIVKLFLFSGASGSASLIEVTGSELKNNFINVESMTPIDLYNHYLLENEIIFIKCDIEGLDIEVLNLFPSEIWNFVGAVSFEWNVSFLQNFSDFEIFLEKMSESNLHNVRFGDQADKLLSLHELRKWSRTDTIKSRNILISRF
jgi:FkbM family methyltransferase